MSLQRVELDHGKRRTKVWPRCESARLADRTVRLPQFQLLAIEAAARTQGVTINEFLAGHLTDLVCIEAPTLAKGVPGFREAFLWPQSQQRQAEDAA